MKTTVSSNSEKEIISLTGLAFSCFDWECFNLDFDTLQSKIGYKLI